MNSQDSDKNNSSIQDINISVLEEITENLSKDDILKIAEEVRQEFENGEEEIIEKSDLRRWYDINYRIVNAILFPIFIGLVLAFFLLMSSIDSGEVFSILFFLGFLFLPFFFIFLGFSYIISKAFNKDTWKDLIR